MGPPEAQNATPGAAPTPARPATGIAPASAPAARMPSEPTRPGSISEGLIDLREPERLFGTILDAPPPAPTTETIQRGRLARTTAVAKLRGLGPRGWWATAGLLLLGLVVVWAAVVFRIKTRDGVIVLEELPKDAEVFVDGERISVTWPGGGKPAVIAVPAGRRGVEVQKGGFKIFGEEVSIEAGDHKRIHVRLEPRAPEVAKADSAARIQKPSETGGQALKTITNSIGMKLVLIPAGVFWMGSPDEDTRAPANEKPQHPVRITQPFYLGVTEVTRGQFRRFVEATGYRTEGERDGKGGGAWNKDVNRWEPNPKFTWLNPGSLFVQTDEHPVVHVSWDDAMAFAAWLSRKEGSTYRLPTEAEWEYACRAGSPPLPPLSGDASSVGEYAMHVNGPRGTHRVDQMRPNAWGLYGMLGNVQEWCADRFDERYYASSPAVDPPGAAQGSAHVRRGSDWYDNGPLPCRPAWRIAGGPGGGCDTLGFRVALNLNEAKVSGSVGMPPAEKMPLPPTRLVHEDDFNGPRDVFPRDPNLSRDPSHPSHGRSDGVYFAYSPKGWNAWPVHRMLSDGTCEVVARVLSDNPRKTAAWFMIVNSTTAERGFLIKINERGGFSLEPSPWYGKEAAAFRKTDPRMGPNMHPAIRPGNEFNKLLLILRKREVVIFVNGVQVCEPVTFDYDVTPALLGFGAAAGPGRAEFDRLEIRQMIRPEDRPAKAEATPKVTQAAVKPADRPRPGPIVRDKPPKPIANSIGKPANGLLAEFFEGREFERKLKARVDANVDWLWGFDAPDPDVPKDNFSARWTGWLKAPRPGRYKIIAVADDGVRLWLDGHLLIDEWHGGLPTRHAIVVDLTGKPQALKLDYLEIRASAVISLRWEQAGRFQERAISSDALFLDELTAQRAAVSLPDESPSGIANGLDGEFFEGINFGRKLKTRIDTQVDWLWGFDAPDPDVPKDNFSARWTGWLKAPRPGRYKIIAVADDGVRLWLDGQLVINAWKGQLPSRYTAEVDLTGKARTLKLEYFEVARSSIISLRWQNFGGLGEQPIPATAFVRERDATAAGAATHSP